MNLGQMEHDPWFEEPVLVRQTAFTGGQDRWDFLMEQVTLIQAFSRRRAARLILHDRRNVVAWKFLLERVVLIQSHVRARQVRLQGILTADNIAKIHWVSGIPALGGDFDSDTILSAALTDFVG